MKNLRREFEKKNVTKTGKTNESDTEKEGLLNIEP